VNGTVQPNCADSLSRRVLDHHALFVLCQISASEKLLSVLNNLYRRDVLDRFVIDEAHCVSQARSLISTAIITALTLRCIEL